MEIGRLQVRSGQIRAQARRLIRLRWIRSRSPTMFSKEYLATARTLLRVARSMADQAIADRLRALAGDYERKAEQASDSEAAQPQSRRSALPDLAENEFE